MREPTYLSWRSRMPEHSVEPDPEYLDTPYLTAAVNICSALGVFVGAWTAIILVGYLQRGFSTCWPLGLIIVLDVALNVAVRVARARRRRALPPEPCRSDRYVKRGPESRQVG